MHYLNEKQIFDITKRLKDEEINFSHLFDDLLDHVCCDIEAYMEQGKNFVEAKKIVYNEIGLNGLREIQEATVLYVKFNLLRMKKLMQVMSLVGTPILITGLLFKLMHWPGANLLFLFGSLMLFLGYFPVALLIVRKELKVKFFSKDFRIYLIGFVVIVETGIAMLFSSLHWPGADIHKLISGITMMFVFFPMLLYRISKNKNNRLVNISLVLFAFVFASIIHIQAYTQKTSVYNVIENVGITEELSYYQSLVEKMNLDYNTPHEFLTARENLEQIITDYQALILDEHETIYQKISHYIDRDPIDRFYDDSFSQLKFAIQSYHTEALLLAQHNKQLEQYINMKLTTEPYQIEGFGEVDWNKRMFNGPAGENLIYTRLNQLLLDVYQVEYEVFRNHQSALNISANIKDAPEL